MAESNGDKPVFQVEVVDVGVGRYIIKFFDKDGNRTTMGCCGQNKVVPTPPPAEEPEEEPPPIIPPPENPPGSIPEEPVPPGTTIPPEELPPEEPPPAPEEPPEDPEEPPQPPPEDPIPPGDPIPDPPPPEPPGIPDPPPETNEFNRVLGTDEIPVVLFADIVIPPGESWRFKNVVMNGNIRVPDTATFAMRPGDYLKFNGNPDAYVGGGMEFTSQFANDFGIWVSAGGRFDVRGTPKLSWNRIGTHETWDADDEYYIAPTDVFDFSARSWSPGDSIPQVDSSLPPAEVVNVTRDVIIEGPGHIHIHSNAAHRMEYFRLEKMGISNVASLGPVTGRYALHLHHSGDMGGLRVRGIAAVNCRGRVFVPHAANNMVIDDCVVINSYAEGLWWDFGHDTDDIEINRLGVIGVRMPEVLIPGATSEIRPGVSLASGTNMVIRNSFVCGVRNGKTSAAFDWPEPTAVFGENPSLVWIFAEGNVAHNNAGPGIRFWTNLGDDHVVENYISYRNALGIENGAYEIGTQYHSVYLYEDGFVVGNDFSSEVAAVYQNANAVLSSPGGIVAQWTDSIFKSYQGPAFKVGHRQLAGTEALLIENCTFIPASGEPMILVSRNPSFPWNALLQDCNVEPDDIEFQEDQDGTYASNEDTHIEIRGGATEWDVDIVGGEKVVTVI